MFISDTTPINSSLGISQVHVKYVFCYNITIMYPICFSCMPFQGPVECIPYMNHSFFYSYTSDYHSKRTDVINLINEPNCSTSDSIQLICNSAYPACEMNSGEPIVVCKKDCTTITSQASCDFLLNTSSSPINCSNPLQFIEEHHNLTTQLSNQCRSLQGMYVLISLY